MRPTTHSAGADRNRINPERERDIRVRGGALQSGLVPNDFVRGAQSRQQGRVI